MKSETPLTDDVMSAGHLQRPTLGELAEHARLLERELHELRRINNNLCEQLAKIKNRGRDA
jgi:hypothetical protein